MIDRKSIFNAVETTLVHVGSQNLEAEILQKRLDEFKYGKKQLDNDHHYRMMVFVIFVSGFRAETANARKDAIFRYFNDYEKAAKYGDADIERIMHDPRMIKNRRKVKACVETARKFKVIIAKHGSFQNYIESFEPEQSFENLILLKEDLAHRFDGLGNITAYHFLTDIGMPVVKPDRVLRRIFHRLGFIEDENDALGTVIEAGKFAKATGHPPRYIDIVFVSYGQVTAMYFGMEQGICLERNPRCEICGVTRYCNYYVRKKTERARA
jgi:DNA-3-methyladenine glycosylase I